MISKDDVAKMKESYTRLKNLKLTAEETGIPWQTVYWWLKKEGVEVTGDKIRYGGDSDKIALIGELYFKNLFPDAVYENENKFQAKCDFSLYGNTVDIKTSSLRHHKSRSGNIVKRWGFNCFNNDEEPIDFFVCFCLKENGKDIEKILLIPSELVVTKTGGLSVSALGSKWDSFTVSEEDLVDFFNNFNLIK